jgi:hypothetical protein
MFLRHTIRKKDGKEHRYFSVVENKRVAGGRVVQRHVLYLGEINDTQELAWRKSIEVFLPLGILAVVRLIPPEIMAENRAAAALCAALAGWVAYRYFLD